MANYFAPPSFLLHHKYFFHYLDSSTFLYPQCASTTLTTIVKSLLSTTVSRVPPSGPNGIGFVYACSSPCNKQLIFSLNILTPCLHGPSCFWTKTDIELSSACQNPPSFYSSFAYFSSSKARCGYLCFALPFQKLYNCNENRMPLYLRCLEAGEVRNLRSCPLLSTFLKLKSITSFCNETV